MNQFNTPVLLNGFLGNAPSVTLTRDHRKIVRASLASNEKRKLSSGNKAIITHWHQLVFFDAQAELAAQHLKKGVQLSIRGIQVHRCYTDRQGKKKHILEVRVDSLLTAEMNQTSLF